jgi:hypothetical protein
LGISDRQLLRSRLGLDSCCQSSAAGYCQSRS